MAASAFHGPGRLAAAAGLLAALACARAPEGPSRRAMALEDLAALEAAVRAFAADHGGALPETLDVLVRPQPEGQHYLPSGTSAIHDPWGRRYLYERPAGEPGFRLSSLGRDGRPGGRGEDEDLDHGLAGGSR